MCIFKERHHKGLWFKGSSPETYVKVYSKNETISSLDYPHRPTMSSVNLDVPPPNPPVTVTSPAATVSTDNSTGGEPASSRERNFTEKGTMVF